MPVFPDASPAPATLPRAWQDNSLRLLRDDVLRHSARELRQALDVLAGYPAALHRSAPGQQLRLRLHAVERELVRRCTHRLA